MDMKINYLIFWMLFLGVAGCSPSEYKFMENGYIDVADVSKIVLRPNHYQLLTDGYAQVDLCPVVFNEAGIEYRNEKLNDDMFEWETVEGRKLPRYFSTADQALNESVFQVFCRLKGTGLISDTVSITMKEPLQVPLYEEFTIPVVFHVVVSEEEVLTYGNLSAARIAETMERLNNIFSGKATRNAAGVNTGIQFVLAQYNPAGELMDEPGINRVTVEEVTEGTPPDKYHRFLSQNNAIWPHEKYLNIWLMSETKYPKFWNSITKLCVPKYRLGSETLPGLSLPPVPSTWVHKVEQIGILFRMRTFQYFQRSIDATAERELVTCIGNYLGLLDTWKINNSNVNDQCNDTFAYGIVNNNGSLGTNSSWSKEVGSYRFLSENIMDDPTGTHRSVSKDQALRMYWVLKNCAGRSMWQSDFALTGKE